MTVEEAGERLIQQLVTRGAGRRRPPSAIRATSASTSRPSSARSRSRHHEGGRRGVHRGLPRQRSVDQEHAQLSRLPAQRLRLRAAQGLGRREPVQGGREAGGRRRGSGHPLPRSDRARCAARRDRTSARSPEGRDGRASEASAAPARRRADAVEGDRGRAGGRRVDGDLPLRPRPRRRAARRPARAWSSGCSTSRRR